MGYLTALTVHTFARSLVARRVLIVRTEKGSRGSESSAGVLRPNCRMQPWRPAFDALYSVLRWAYVHGVQWTWTV